jgi:hypothetical protein
MKCEQIKRQAGLGLFNLDNQESRRTATVKRSPADTKEGAADADADAGHVMLSYPWA